MESLEAQEKFYSESHFIILTYLFILDVVRNTNLTHLLQVLLVRRIEGSSLTAGKALVFYDKDKVTPCQSWTHLMAA